MAPREPSCAPSAVEQAGPARPRAEVVAAVAAAPGLASASREAQGRARRRLTEGNCVVDALASTVGTVNRHAAAALIGSIGDC